MDYVEYWSHFWPTIIKAFSPTWNQCNVSGVSILLVLKKLYFIVAINYSTFSFFVKICYLLLEQTWWVGCWTQLRPFVWPISEQYRALGKKWELLCRPPTLLKVSENSYRKKCFDRFNSKTLETYKAITEKKKKKTIDKNFRKSKWICLKNPFGVTQPFDYDWTI